MVGSRMAAEKVQGSGAQPDRAARARRGGGAPRASQRHHLSRTAANDAGDASDADAGHTPPPHPEADVRCFAAETMPAAALRAHGPAADLLQQRGRQRYVTARAIVTKIDW